MSLAADTEVQYSADMAVENESDPERIRELESGSEDEEKVWTGRGRFSKGKWYCDCDGDVRARCRTAGRKAKLENRGKKYWTCSKNERESCRFYLWVEDEERAKRWHRKHGLAPDPETPPPPRLDWSVNPFTMSSKRKSSKSVSFEDENGLAGPANEDDEPPDSPSRKARKLTHPSTPNLALPSRIHAAANTLPSPESEQKPNGESSSSSRFLNGKSPASGIEIDGDGDDERKSSLATTIIKLLRSENVDLKESTELQIGHELDLVTDKHEAEVRRYKQTISKISKRLDELESLAVHFVDDVGLDDEVVFSD